MCSWMQCWAGAGEVFLETATILTEGNGASGKLGRKLNELMQRVAHRYRLGIGSESFRNTTLLLTYGPTIPLFGFVEWLIKFDLSFQNRQVRVGWIVLHCCPMFHSFS
jgi:hypothetical protein